jgi:ribosomal protein S18 acetylase RimI-like enzyme
MRFRRAQPEDVPAIVALVESAYRGDVSRRGWTTEADLLDGQRTDPDEVTAAVAGPATVVVLAETPEGLQGSVLLREEADAVYLGMFAVRPGLQGRGLGSALLREAERVTREELGRHAVRMTVLAQRPELIAWYRRRGYQVTGAREPFPYGNPRFGLPRTPDLVFEVLRKSLDGAAPFRG